LAQWLKRPENSPALLPAELRLGFSDDLWDTIETELKYAGYIQRQNTAIDRLHRTEDNRLPVDLDYHLVPSLRAETRQKLTQIRPTTLGQASRISGITPADIALLSIYLRRF
jgi:tRNA uridine 5-carboxymethylaminomethyl modification enzyme